MKRISASGHYDLSPASRSAADNAYGLSTFDGYIHPMPEELTSLVELPFRHRVRHGVRKPQNWLQLTRFAAVGASGYAVNLVVFALCVHLFGINYKLAAVAAFAVSVLNNFWWNRHWTFRS
jgi:GtrA-like protein